MVEHSKYINNMVLTLIQPKLGLSKKTDAKLAEDASNILVQLTLNAAKFPSVTVGDVQKDYDDFATALSKVKHGTPSETEAKNQARIILENRLKITANQCVENADGNLVIFKLSGFEVKSKPTPSGNLPAPKSFSMDAITIEGTLTAKFPAVKHAVAYELYYGTANTTPEEWTKFKLTTAGKVMINDLESGVSYSARVRAVGAKGKKGEWSEIVTRKTY